VPIAAVLRGANGEGVRLNGVVHFSAFPQNPLTAAARLGLCRRRGASGRGHSADTARI
jgi:hypothetical protein